MATWTNTNTWSALVANGNSGSSPTINWNSGQLQSITLNAATVTPSFTAPPGATTLNLLVSQDTTGGRAVTWPSSVTWIGGSAPTLLNAPSSVTLISFFFDGTTYWGEAVTANSDSYVVNFVIDGGADPTGVADCGPAITKCGTILTTLAANTKLPLKSLVLLIPPGIYSVASAPSSINFGTNNANLIIQGFGDASILSIGCGTGSTALGVFNASNVLVRDLTFVGSGNSSTVADCDKALMLGGLLCNRIQNVNFIYILATTAVVQSGSARQFVVEDCIAAGCGALNEAVIWSQLDRWFFCRAQVVDPATLNGFTFSATKIGVAYIRHDGGETEISQFGGVHIEHTFADEDTAGGIVIAGDPSGLHIPHVLLTQNTINPPVEGARGPSLSITHVSRLKIEGHTATGLNTTVPGAAIALSDVLSTSIDGLTVNPSAVANFITTDSLCGLLEITNSPTVLPSYVQSSSATATYLTQNGVRALLATAAGTLVANALVKASTTGGVPLLVTDVAAAVLGTSLDSVSLAAKYRQTLPSQIVTMLSDGTGVIEPGDLVVPSPTTAGLVVKNRVTGTPTLGQVTVGDTALSANDPISVLAAPQTDGQFYPGAAGAVAWWTLDQPGPSAVSSGVVAQLTDLVGGVVISQATSGNRPAFSINGGPGGWPKMTFSPLGGTQALQTAAAALSLAAPFEYFLVMTSAAHPVTNNDWFCDFGNQNAAIYIPATTDKLTYINAGNGPQVTITEAVPLIANAQVGTTSTTLVVRQSGATTSASASVATSTVTGTITLGNYGGENSGGHGDIMALVVFPALLSVANRAKVLARLQAQWSIA
jgi:hypothetical protein